MTFIKYLFMSGEIIQNLEGGKRDFWIAYQWSTKHYLMGASPPPPGVIWSCRDAYFLFPFYYWLGCYDLPEQVLILEACFTEEETEVLERLTCQGLEEGTKTQTQINLLITCALNHDTVVTLYCLFI